jgi:hypothetical protein
MSCVKPVDHYLPGPEDDSDVTFNLHHVFCARPKDAQIMTLFYGSVHGQRAHEEVGGCALSALSSNGHARVH